MQAFEVDRKLICSLKNLNKKIVTFEYQNKKSKKEFIMNITRTRISDNFLEPSTNASKRLGRTTHTRTADSYSPRTTETTETRTRISGDFLSPNRSFFGRTSSWDSNPGVTFTHSPYYTTRTAIARPVTVHKASGAEVLGSIFVATVLVIGVLSLAALSSSTSRTRTHCFNVKVCRPSFFLGYNTCHWERVCRSTRVF